MEKGKVVTLEDRIPKLREQKKQKANKVFILYISLFFLLLLCVVYFQSSLSRISSIEVTGNHYISEEEVIGLSQLSERTGYWNVNLEEVASKIESNEEIKEVIVDRKFPNKMMIITKEYDRIAYLATEGTFFPVLETGRILSDEQSGMVPADAPILLNWKQGEELQEMAAELRKVPKSVLNRISEIHHDPIKFDPMHLTLYMNDGYEVSVTIREFSKKISLYPSIISKLSPEDKGIIHLEVGSYFKSYEKEGEVNSES